VEIGSIAVIVGYLSGCRSRQASYGVRELRFARLAW
jgi:hypothetical protein